MYDRILKQMREKVRLRQYVMTLHAEEEMDEDELSSVWRAVFLLAESLNDKEIDPGKSGSTWFKVKQSVAKFGYAGKLVSLTVYAVR
jgi:hypothetical protein